MVASRDDRKRVASRLTDIFPPSFLVFPSAFADSDGVSVDQSTAAIAAVVVLALGYSLSAALWFICTSQLFRLDVIFMYFPLPSP